MPGPVRVVRRNEFGPESNRKIHAASVGVAAAFRRGSRLAPVLLNLIRILSSPAFMGIINCLWIVSGIAYSRGILKKVNERKA